MSSVDFAEKAFLDGKSIPLETTTPLPDLVITEKLGYNQSRRASSAFHSDVFKGPDMSPLRKWSILGIFCLSVFIDILLGSAFFVFTGIVARDLEILVEQQSWIISAYSCTFAICLLLMGRIVDLYNPRMVFCVGFLVVGIINLALSFVVEKYSFFVLRALAGVSCAAVVPSAYRMIPVIFPPEQRHRAYTLYGMTGSIANTTGTVIAGVFGLINASGSSGASQMSSWKWFLRLVGVVTIPVAILSFKLLDFPNDMTEPAAPGKWKRLDLVGAFSILSAILCLILGLTFGASYGWGKGGFIGPIVISAILFPFFFWWEARIPTNQAMIPPSLWRLPNFTVLMVFSLVTVTWWGTNFIVFIEQFHLAYGETVILSAIRTIPEGIIALIVSVILVLYPRLNAKPKWPICGALVLCATASILWTQAPELNSIYYWKYVFPGMIIGSGAMQVVLLCSVVGVMLTVPPEQAGVAGAMLQTSWQIGMVVGLSIQSGLMTIQPGGVTNLDNVQTSWYFVLGWTVLWGIGFAVFYRPAKNINKEVDPATAAI